MKVILPVAGKGTRLRPHTHTKAKSLVHVAGKTVLEHIIERLQAIKVDQYLFITDENGQQIETFMDKKFPGLNCRYFVQKERLGPAHAVALAAPAIADGDDVLVVFNDTIFVTDLGLIPQLTTNVDGLIYSKEVEDFQRFGVNVVQDGVIVDMVEKPDKPISRLAQVGLYYLKDGAKLMRAIQATMTAGEKVKGEYYLPAVFMRMINEGCRFAAPEIDAWLDCGKSDTLLETNRYLLSGNHHVEGQIVNAVIIEPVAIAKGARVEDAIVGPNVSIAAGSVVRSSIVRDSIINTDSLVEAVILERSILGDNVTLKGASRRMNIGDHSIIEMVG